LAAKIGRIFVSKNVASAGDILLGDEDATEYDRAPETAKQIPMNPAAGKCLQSRPLKLARSLIPESNLLT
jgi:hypothetical protein